MRKLTKKEADRQKELWGDYYCIKAVYPKSTEYYGKEFAHFPVYDCGPILQLDNFFLQYCYKKRGGAENLIKKYMKQAEEYAKENGIEDIEFEFKSMEVVSVMETFDIY